MEPPSPFVLEWLPRLRRELPSDGLALDVAMGDGRHALILADLGFRTIGIDIDEDRVRTALVAVRHRKLALALLIADLTRIPLPTGKFHLILVSRYLDRDLFEALRAAVAPGGFVLYETFTEDQLQHPTGPRSPAHLLRHGELRKVFADWDIVFEEETVTPSALARVVARKPK